MASEPVVVRTLGAAPRALCPNCRRACDDADVADSSDGGDTNGSGREDGHPARPPAGKMAVAAFLRVYEPLGAFPAQQRAEWRTLASAGGPTAAEHAAREHSAALRALSALPPRLVTDLDLGADRQPAAGPAIVLAPPAPDGEIRVCPADLSWRSLLALDEFQSTIAVAVLSAFLPGAVIEEASRVMSDVGSAARRPPHVRNSAWGVPLAWFAPFQPRQRLTSRSPSQPAVPSAVDSDGTGPPSLQPDADQPRGSEPAVSHGAEPHAAEALELAAGSLRYLAPMADARRGIARALAAVRRTPTDLLPAAGLEELGRWLEEFHAKSFVELDYAGLAGLIKGIGCIGSDGAVTEDSVGEVIAALARLRGGDADAGLSALADVRARWDAIRAFEHAS
ncbi:MAG: hypothetical protein QOJ62_554 [Actinomycetota bacterium]|nr:hypothetical protein [Actinomycetota bacterium]